MFEWINLEKIEAHEYIEKGNHFNGLD